MADYEHGKMNIDVQEKTFASFVNWIKYSVIGIFVFLIFLALVGG